MKIIPVSSIKQAFPYVFGNILNSKKKAMT